jgi:hypothetical protein
VAGLHDNSMLSPPILPPTTFAGEAGLCEAGVSMDSSDASGVVVTSRPVVLEVAVAVWVHVELGVAVLV